MNPEHVITRFPPSPTGYLHIGSVRTALFNFLYAKRHGGAMIFRFEDTDRERSKKEFEDDIIEGIHWLGLEYKQPPVFRQSERTGVYKDYLSKLILSGHAYEAEESTQAPGMNVIRFKNPNVVVTFNDAVRGEVSFDTTELGDFVIARTHDLPLYHLAVVIDDAEAGVTHVIRGEDHISNTQRQILLLEAMGFTRPQYAHIPLILAPDRTKLSKRHGAVSVTQYRADGFIPEAIINYLALLGWNPGGDRELFTLQELVDLFNLDHVHKGGAIFDVEKLRWFNHEHIKRLSVDDFKARYIAWAGGDPALPDALWTIIKNGSATLMDAKTQIASGQFDFLKEHITYSSDLLLKGAKADAVAVKAHLAHTHDVLEGIAPEHFTDTAVKEALFGYATDVGRASVLWPLRVALSGMEKSPDPFTLAGVLGKDITLSRIAAARALL